MYFLIQRQTRGGTDNVSISSGQWIEVEEIEDGEEGSKMKQRKSVIIEKW
jgi:hypothetical protein